MAIHWLWIAIPAALTLALFAGYVCQRIGAARDAVRCPPSGKMIDVGGRRLHIIRKGSGGPTVVIENGASGASFIWWGHQDQLAESTTVCTYDRAGLGWSDRVPLPRTMEERAADLHAVLVHANVPPPYVLVGYSYGGFLIRLFARDHRDEVAGMVFVDAGHEAVYSDPAVRSYTKKMSTIFRVLGGAAHIGLLRLLRMQPMKPPDAMLTPAQRHVLANSSATAHPFFVGADEFSSVQHSGTAMAGTNAPGSLGDLPIAVITHGLPFPGSYGVLEKYWRTGQEQLAALSTNSTLIVAQKSYHDIPLTEPELVLETIRKVVAAVRCNERLAISA